MTDTEIVERAADQAHDRGGHRLVWICVGLALVGVATLAVVVVQLAVRADDYATSARALHAQVEELGAVPVVDAPPVDDPDPDDPDPDDAERQEPEVQEPEVQDPEAQESEVQEPELPDVERDDTDPDDPEIQDDEIQDPEIDDPPVQGPPPAGWRWVDGDGRTQTCTRDGGTDAAPLYTCTAEPPPETVPGSLPLPIGGRP